MTIAIEHGKPRADIDGYDEFEVDFGRALRFALMDPKLAGELSPEQRHVGQIIGNFMAKSGKGLKLGVRKIADATGYGRTMVAKHIIALRIWSYLNVMSPAKKGGSTTFETNISKEIALTRWCEAKRKEKQQLEREVSALEADSEMSRLSTYGPDSATGVSTPRADSRYEVSAPTVHFHGESVRCEPESVHPKGGHTLTTLKDSLAGTRSGEDSNVVPLGTAETEWLTKKLSAYGKAGTNWAQRTAGFIGCDLMEAAGELETWADAYGALNVVEAIQDAMDQKEIRTTPKKVIRSFATSNANKHGKRPMHKDAEESPIRRLTMAERSFRC